jgi:uncharacterized BrkB/YihY/UPF0761 family membrane protein
MVAGLILAAAGTMAVASSIQVIYERAFSQRHRGWRDMLRFAALTALFWIGLELISSVYFPRRSSPTAGCTEQFASSSPS